MKFKEVFNFNSTLNSKILSLKNQTKFLLKFNQTKANNYFKNFRLFNFCLYLILL